MKKAAAILIAMISTNPLAQNLVHADFANVTTAVSRDEIGIDSCGLNFMIAAGANSDKATIFDFSVNLYSTGHGLIKAGSQGMHHSKTKGWVANKNARLPKPDLVWFAKPDDSVSIRPVKYTNAQTSGYVIAGVPMVDAAQLLLATLEGEPLQVAMQYEGDRLHQVMGFRGAMSEENKAAYSACVSGLLKRMEQQMSKEVEK